MRLTRSIFDSASERAAFRALEDRWSTTLDLYPQLPLSKIVELEQSDDLREGELRTFYGTNVDYTFCDRSDRPLFSIEFDGIGHGFSHGGAYRQARRTTDRSRKLKMDFKLRVTRELGYPLFVLSFEELEILDPVGAFTILDGIVAQMIVKREEASVLEHLLEEQAEQIAAFPPHERREYTSGLVVDAGVIAELDNDPLARARWVAADEASSVGHNGACSYEWVYDPALPESDGVGVLGISTEVLRARIRGFEHAERVGCRATVPTPLKDVTRTVWLRNFGRHAGVMPEQIAENAALMLAFREAAELMGRGAAA